MYMIALVCGHFMVLLNVGILLMGSLIAKDNVANNRQFMSPYLCIYVYNYI